MNYIPVNNQMSEPSFSSVRWRMIAPTLFVLWVVGMFDKIGVAVISTNKAFLIDMNLVGKPVLIGSLVTGLLFSYGIGFFIWGWLTDHFGPKKCAIVGLVLWGLSTCLAAIAPNFVTLLVSRICLGFAEAFLWPVSNSLTARWFPLSERGRAKAIWINGINVGAAFTGFLVLSLLHQFSWRIVFWVLTLLAWVICLPMVYWLVQDQPTNHKNVSQFEINHIMSEQLTQEDEKVKIKVKGVLSSSFWMLILSYIASTIGFYGLSTWFPSYLVIMKHFNANQTSSYMVLAYMVALIAVVFVGMHTDKTQKKAIWLAGSFVAALVCLLFAINLSSAITDAIMIAIAIAFVQITTLTIIGLMHSMSSTERIGTSTGIATGFTDVVAAFGPTIMGALIAFDHGSYVFAFMFLIGIFVIGALGGYILQRQSY
ncbi:MFS transporter [Alicyclobacillus fastidiosus]|uniref:MFS transporter n=1 Tax=Alicyclobacillus fastidiosus TaxID=392011 RepID=A0ABY6ZEW4_9BACL|nr:MFS transporter [Alicyclobacillus fastidiosus]WAH40661.1 MFS transporter [Alicyclobacillus fastidiosus]GMA62122.1 MFS transporter [Alicyclobacillus fastidiosus]